MLLEFSELTVLSSSFLSSYFQWEQQFHLKRKKDTIGLEQQEHQGTKICLSVFWLCLNDFDLH